MSTRNSLPFSNQFERGHSFNWAGQWEEGKHYFNDEYVTDFITFGSCTLACRKNHISTQENKPKIIFDNNNNTPIGVEGQLWSFVNTSMNGSIFKFLTYPQYYELETNNLIEPNVLYFIYDNNG